MLISRQNKALDCLQDGPRALNGIKTAFLIPKRYKNSSQIASFSSRSRVSPRQSVRKCVAFTQKYVRPFRAGPGKTELADRFSVFDQIPRMVMVSDNRTYGDITTADRSSAQSLAVPKL